MKYAIRNTQMLQRDVWVAPFNGSEMTMRLMEQQANNLAARIVEPLQRALKPAPGVVVDRVNCPATAQGTPTPFANCVRYFDASMASRLRCVAWRNVV